MGKDGHASFFTTKLDAFINWGQRHAMWPMPFGTSCCGIEMMATLSADYDMARFGSEAIRFSPRQADLVICAGIVNSKMSPILKTVYDQMSEPKWVMSFGACASSGGVFPVYSVTQGIDNIIPVDIYVPGCPPSPDAVLFALLELRERIKRGDTHSQRRIREKTAAPVEYQSMVSGRAPVIGSTVPSPQDRVGDKLGLKPKGAKV